VSLEGFPLLPEKICLGIPERFAGIIIAIRKTVSILSFSGVLFPACEHLYQLMPTGTILSISV